VAHLATFEDANRWLDESKILFDDATDADDEATEADSIVRAMLFDVFGDLVNDWDGSDDPPPTDPTPPVVRTIAGLLMASYRYAKVYSEETVDASSYAQALENRAMALIMGIKDGSIELGDTTITSGVAWSRDDFWPNDLTTDDNDDPIRFATMEKEF